MKKILSLILTLVLVMNIVPFSVGAEEYTGTCGDNLTWTFDSDAGALVISGSGLMPDFTTSNRAPWYEYRASITSVEIDFEVQSIGNYAFADLTALEEIEVPENVTSIGRWAFTGCTSLETMTLPFVGNSPSTNPYLGYIFGANRYQDNASYVPASLTTVILSDSCISLSTGAFYGCANIENISVPDTLTVTTSYVFDGCTSLNYSTYDNAKYLGNSFNPYVVLISAVSTDISSCNIHNDTKVIHANAFYNCARLRNITIPYQVVSIGNQAFYGCTLLYVVRNNSDNVLSFGSTANGYLAYYADVIIDKNGIKSYRNSQYILDDDGFLFRVSGNNYTLIAYTGNESAVTLPLTVEGSSYSISQFRGASDVTIPEGFTSISNYAFDGCTELRYVTLPSTLTTLGYRAFADTAIEEIEIPRSLDSCRQQSGNNYYSYNGKSYQICDGPFYCCESLKTVTFETGTTQIAQNLFAGCTGLESIVIPDTVTTVEQCAFQGCLRLNNVYIGEAVTSIGGSAFRTCISLETLVIPDYVTLIDGYAFSDCTSLREVTLSKSLATLGYMAFAHTAIEEIEIPKTLNSTGGSPFYNCEELKVAMFEAGLTQIPSSTFLGCPGLETVIIPDTVTSIGDSAFQYCTSLEEVTIPDSVITIGNCAFDGCTSLENVTLSKSLTTLGYRAFADTSIEEIEIPRSLDSCRQLSGNNYYSYNGKSYQICDGPFYCCESLKTVTFETGTTQIAQNLFAGCTGLESIVIPDTVTTVEQCAFQGCLRLNNVYIGEAVTSIGGSAFRTCISLETLVIPDYVTLIDGYAFSDCTSLREVTLSKSLTTLGYRAFENTAIEEIEIPKTFNYTGGSPFYNCKELKVAMFETGLTQIPASTFSECPGLETVIIPDTVTSIGEYAFEFCPSLEEVTIPDSVVTIGEYAFRNCTSLSEVILPESLINLGNYVFRNCSSLEYVKINSNRQNIPEGTFQYCTSLTDIDFNNKLTGIDQYAFSGCTALETLDLPASLNTIAQEAFKNCTSLSEIVFPSSLQTIGRRAFYGCSSLTEAILPAPLNTIEEYAFYGCSSLESVHIPYSCRTIGQYAFYGCEALSSLTFDDYCIATIPKYCFYQCYDLESVVIPKGCTTIADSAFKNCIKLFNVTVPASVTSIASSALSYPNKTTIFGKSGTYAETFANNGGFTFVDNAVSITGIALVGGVEEITLECGESYYAQFEYDPANATDVIWMTSSNSKVSISMHKIISQSAGDSVITIHTTTGVENTFTIHNKSVNRIELTSLPNIRNYDLNDVLDLTGLEVTVLYNDGSTKTVDNYTVSGFDSETEGTKNVTVSWVAANGYTKTASFTVSVVDSMPRLTGIAVDTMPTKTVYNRREPLDTTGLVIVASYNNGTEAPIDTYRLSTFNTLRVGDQTITVTASDKYGTFTTSFVVTVMADHEHTPGEPVIVNETCTTAGSVKVYCTACGELISEEVIPADGHTVEVDAGWAASCADVGMTDGSHCSVCGEILVAQTVIPKLSHDFVDTVVPATYWERGYTLHTCTNCGAVYKDNYTDYGGELSPDTPVIKLFPASAKAGDTVDVKVAIANNPGIVSMSLSLVYDDTVLTLEDVTPDEAFGGQFIFGEKAVWLFGSDTTANGTIMTLTFRVAFDAALGDTEVTVTYREGEICDHDENLVVFAVSPAAVSVIDRIAGDINGDGVVDNRDLTRLMRYLAGEEVEVVAASLDVNGDGVVDNRDLTRHMRYLAGEEVEIF